MPLDFDQLIPIQLFTGCSICEQPFGRDEPHQPVWLRHMSDPDRWQIVAMGLETVNGAIADAVVHKQCLMRHGRPDDSLKT